MTPRQTNLEQIFETQIQALALTLRPSSVDNYRSTARCFLAYLRATFPQLCRLSQLRRDPHLLGWFRWLSEQEPPLSNATRIGHLIRLRRLLTRCSGQRRISKTSCSISGPTSTTIARITHWKGERRKRPCHDQ